MNDVMGDLETLGNTPGSAPLSIGLVAFDPATGEIGDSLYVVVNTMSCMVAGLHADQSTLDWWQKQSPEAQKVIFEAKAVTTSTPLPEALRKVNSFLARHDARNVRLWGNGSDFDNAILTAAYRACGIEPGWKFWNSRCFRTLKNLYPDVPMPDRVGTYHNAKDDAETQAIHACMIFQRMRNVDSVVDGAKAVAAACRAESIDAAALI